MHASFPAICSHLGSNSLVRMEASLVILLIQVNFWCAALFKFTHALVNWTIICGSIGISLVDHTLPSVFESGCNPQNPQQKQLQLPFSSHMRFRTGSIQPECQNDASNIWRRYHRYVELGQVNMQEIVNFEQSQQNVEGRFPIQSDMFLLSRI